MDIRFVKRDVLKEKPDQKHLGFGKYMTDYMFVMDWTKEDGCENRAGRTDQSGACLCDAALCAGDI